MWSRKTKNSTAREKKDAELFARALAALRNGEVVVFPTETFYGLGADAFHEPAVERVASLKGRDPDSPIPLIISDREMLNDVVSDFPPAARRLGDHFWPGPLTLVLPAKAGLSSLVRNRNGAAGVRISSHPVATALARELGHPLTATSANPSGREPARTIAEARAYFSGAVEVFLDGGELGSKEGSTVVEIFRDQLKVIREGRIGSQELERVLAAAHQLCN